MKFRQFLESYDKLGTNIKKGHTIEARGVKGKNKEQWARSFKDKIEMDQWVKDNDAKVFGTAFAKELTEGKDANAVVIKSNINFSKNDTAIEDILTKSGWDWEGVAGRTITIKLKNEKVPTPKQIDSILQKFADRFDMYDWEEVDVKITEASPDKDGFMPMNYRPGPKHTIEAYGVKGMQNKTWRKFFKDRAALDKWVEDNDAEVYGTADIKK